MYFVVGGFCVDLILMSLCENGNTEEEITSYIMQAMRVVTFASFLPPISVVGHRSGLQYRLMQLTVVQDRGPSPIQYVEHCPESGCQHVADISAIRLLSHGRLDDGTTDAQSSCIPRGCSLEYTVTAGTRPCTPQYQKNKKAYTRG